MTATIGRARELRYDGLEQFPARGSYGGIDYCIAGAKPYTLEFANEVDVICLLLGDIFSKAKFEDDSEEALLFHGETAAFHPRKGNVRVATSTVHHGFIAFSYSNEFQASISDRSLDGARSAGSTNNIRLRSISHLANYARERLRFNRPLDPLEINYLGGLVYLETMRGLHSVKPARAAALSDAEFDRLTAFIDAELESDISCARLSRIVELPLRVVFEGIKARTGLPPYQFVLKRRVEQAQKLLSQSDLSIAEVAFRCGFSSQQHMTSVLNRKLGYTPGQVRSKGLG
ncbi:AraC family transcriptional regulator [Sinorhizobium psoraleae]|uniref:AraC family transcriptional regulator n=1 Tax=Sinorhizobium psoraleae TaxID=520838 RepID=A0ABT4KS33_9HYPH|nr:AraC family transcriptional regulator [Sinorhizobium psoraleae]MCZ4094111.1 AraC family transcriptional regulator [Sinorhizobium psoraleae]